MYDIEHVVHALNTMYSNASQQDKLQAMGFLELFQKSKESWEICNTFLHDSSSNDIQTKLFLSQTLRNKLTYDLEQINDNNITDLRNVILKLILKYNDKSTRLVRIQLNICICQLILQDLTWQHPLNDLVDFYVNNNLISNLLEFLKILPEELNDINKTYLTDEEFNSRTNLIMSQENIEKIFMLLNSFISGNELLVLDCLNNWIKELPIESFLKIESLTNLIFNSLNNEDLFEKAIECLITIIRETRDIENLQIVNALLNKLVEFDGLVTVDEENFELLARLYIEGCESWHVLIAKHPHEFKGLVEILLKFLRNDEEFSIIQYSFYFWYLLKQLLTIPTFRESKLVYQPIYGELIKVILVKLTYPNDENFGGDKEQEDKFKEFRYEMADVLKDATVIVGPVRALSIPFEQIKTLTQQSSPRWQDLESALFSMRSMAKEVPTTENTILPQIMNFLIQLPEHPKIRYSATLVLGRYTEWTNKNPQYLEMQLNYIIKGFNTSFEPKVANQILIASTHALMYFCQDCSKLLVNYLEQLYLLYNEIHTKIDIDSNIELIEGIAYILRNFEENDSKLYDMSLSFLNPILNNLSLSTDEKAIGDSFDLIAVFFKTLKVKDYDNYDNKLVKIFVENILPVLKTYLQKYLNVLHINEKILKVLKVSIESYSIYLLDDLQDIMTVLIEGFKFNHFGCYLYVSGSILKVFGDEESYDLALIEAIFKFGMEQCDNFFKILTSTPSVNDIPDVIEDFFRMLDDLLMYYPNQFFDIDDNIIIQPSIESSMLLFESLENFESTIAIIHYLIDFISWGSNNIPISFIELKNEAGIKNIVLSILASKGHQILSKLIHGLIFKFNNSNNDTIIYDLNELILKIILQSPTSDVPQWLINILSNLPNNDEKQLNKFNSTVTPAIQNKDQKRIRNSLKDYINWYTRKNVTRAVI